MPADIAGLLSTGIDGLREGGTVDACMAKADIRSLSSAEQGELRALLEQSAALLELGKLGVPSPGAKAANRARFLNAVVQQREQSRAPSARGWLAGTSGLWRGLARAALSLALVLVVGVGAVSASVESLPGSPLYRVKLAAEDLRLVLAFEHPARAELYMRFADQRGGEIVRLATAGASADEAVLRRMAWQWEGALKHAEWAASDVGPRLLEDVLESSRRQGELLRLASTGAIPDTQLGLNAGAEIAEGASQQAQEALKRINVPPAQPTAVTAVSASPTGPTTDPAAVVPTASEVHTPTASDTALPLAPSSTPKTATGTPTLDAERSPVPSNTPSQSAVPGLTATHTAQLTAEPTGTAQFRTPTPSSTPLPSDTPQAKFALTLADTPDPVPATYRIHYVICVVNDDEAALTNVVVTDRWSPRECVYSLPGNPEELSWTIGTVNPQSQSCRAFDLNTYSICGGRTVTNAAVMTCDQGTAGAVEYTRIIGTPTPAATPTMTGTVTPTGTLTATLTPALTPTAPLTATLESTPTVTPTLAAAEDAAGSWNSTSGATAGLTIPTGSHSWATAVRHLAAILRLVELTPARSEQLSSELSSQMRESRART